MHLRCDLRRVRKGDIMTNAQAWDNAQYVRTALVAYNAVFDDFLRRRSKSGIQLWEK